MIRGALIGEEVAFAPLLICADLQTETMPGDRTGSGAALALDRCAALLALWRERRWPVAHLRRIARPSWFDQHHDQWDWIEGFRPRPGELTFGHALPSAFSSTRFAEYLRTVRPSPNYLIGCALDETILATAIDGYHRGHQFHVIEDAVLCTPLARAAGRPAAHRSTVLHILHVFTERVRSEAVITPSLPIRADDTLAAHSKGAGAGNE
jgi:nicotinamidase-related amidase